MTAWLIRHGQSRNNAGFPATDYATVPLTELGREQALTVAGSFSRAPDLMVASPFSRSQETAEPLMARFPGTPREIWPVQEFTYLSPAACVGSTLESRRGWAEGYWARADPNWRSADDAETFAEFIGRLTAFQAQLAAQADRFVAVFGHGQFFRAYILGLEAGFTADGDWMRRFRAAETSDPLRNGEVVVIEDGRLTERIRHD